jgi:outer membrane receptor protein involved in Fe transport
LGVALLLVECANSSGLHAQTPNSLPDTELQEVTVSSQRLGLIGTADTSSQGVVVAEELNLTPAYRPAALLETVPGLTVTSHSGEGKANQYLMRGFNLDHGTDLAVFVDGMPINEPTHAHGQGYTDLNFLIPELVSGLSFTKGPYFADEGDFASVGSIHMLYPDSIPGQISASVGTLGYQRLFGAGSVNMGHGQLLGAAELQHYDGPWVNPDDQRKVNAVMRYTQIEGELGFSVTAMFYHGLWNATTDQPIRAIDEGLISRYGSLDPSDGGQAQRASLSSLFHAPVAGGTFTANAYVISNHLTLWNDFTHFLVDPVHGDQEAQHEDRTTVGGAVAYARRVDWLGVENRLLAGLQLRDDFNEVSRLPTQDRKALSPSDDPLGFSEDDRVRLSSAGAYAQATSYWTYWLRSTLGVREDFVHESDTGTNSGTTEANLFQPKASLIFTPGLMTELYLSVGRGFHTDDARGVNQARAEGLSGAPLIAPSKGAEVGIRKQFGEQLAATLTFFRLDFQSETTYDPDVGQDSAGPPSRRVGGELNVTYKALRWLELYSTVAATRARYTIPSDDGTGHIGKYIPDSPNVIGSLAAYVKNLGPWSGGLELRYLGSHPLTPDDAIVGDGYAEWNADIRYLFRAGWTVGLGLYNLFNVHANAAEFWYVDRLRGEPAAGIADLHIHPLEPFTARLTFGKTF